MKVLSMLIVLCAFLATQAYAKDTYIDRRNQTDATGSSYYVTFVQRGGSATGHAFVVWTAEDHRRRSSVYMAYGLYPRKGSQAFSQVPSGELSANASDGNSQLVRNTLTVRVDYEEWEASLDAIDDWKTRDYRLFTQNCISFLADVAKIVGLSAPKKKALDFPSTYLQKLIGNNAQAR